MMACDPTARSLARTVHLSRRATGADDRDVENAARQPDLVPSPRPPARWRDWAGWGVAFRMSLALGLGAVLLFTLAVPDFGGCCHGVEASAISNLRSISSAEAQFVEAARIDLDGDDIAEFGGFRELSGGAPLRGTDAPLDPPVLPGVFRSADATGAVRRGLYWFRIHLRTSSGAWVGPDIVPEFVDADGAETGFVCYAWPAMPHQHARRTFVVDETGTILATDAQPPAGSSGPLPGAASGAGVGLFAGMGADGNVWKRVN